MRLVTYAPSRAGLLIGDGVIDVAAELGVESISVRDVLERIRDRGKDRLDQFGRLVVRQPNLLIDRVGQLSAGHRMTGHDALPLLLGRLSLPKNFVKLQSVVQRLSS